jgi:hypothetical protein
VDIQQKPLKPLKRQRNKPEGNAPDFDLRSYLYQMAGVDLTQIDGIKALTAMNILSEIGLDMNKSYGCSNLDPQRQRLGRLLPQNAGQTRIS